MRILLIPTHDVISHPVSHRHLYIAEELVRMGHEVVVAHFRTHDKPMRSFPGMKIVDCTLFASHNSVIHYSLNAPYHFIRFLQIISDEHIDVVIASHVLAGSAAIIAAHIRGIGVVYDIPDHFPTSASAYIRNPLVGRFAEWFVEKVMVWNARHADVVTVMSPSYQDEIRQRWGIESETIIGGVNTRLFKPGGGKEMRARLGIEPSEPVVGFIGSLERWYAIDEMIRALPELRSIIPYVRYLIVGSSLFTGYLDECKALAVRLGVDDRIVWAESVPYEDVPAYIDAMDICTIPLRDESWGKRIFPTKLFEYSACQKPVLCSDTMPQVKAMKLPNVLWYSDCTTFVHRVLNLVDAHPHYRLNAELFSWKARAEQMEKILESLANKRQTTL